MCQGCTPMCGGRTSKSQTPNPTSRIPTEEKAPQRHRDSEENLTLCVSESLWPVFATWDLEFGIWGLGFAQRAAKNDGSGMSRMVRKPGGAVITCGIAFTVIDALAMVTWTPPP